MKRTLDLYVIGQSKAGNSIKCSMTADGKQPFYLPKSQIKPYGIVRKNQMNKFDVPEWLCLSHRQICGDEAYDEEMDRKRNDPSFKV
jgi:hypothetical protein